MSAAVRKRYIHRYTQYIAPRSKFHFKFKSHGALSIWYSSSITKKVLNECYFNAHAQTIFGLRLSLRPRHPFGLQTECANSEGSGLYEHPLFVCMLWLICQRWARVNRISYWYRKKEMYCFFSRPIPISMWFCLKTVN